MFPNKRNSHFPLVNGEEFQGKKSIVNGGRSQRKSIESDHWSFLEEIDAPMWVDLKLESKSIIQDIDDAWFQISHPFHQCSSRELISAFSDLGEETANSNTNLPGSSSPKLPPSVSKSRGKDFRNKKWRGDDRATSVYKKHPIKVLGQKTLPVVLRPNQEVKSKTSFANSERTSKLKARPEAKSLQTKPSSGNTKCTSNLKRSLAGESSSTDTTRPSFTPTNTSFGESERTSSLNACSVCESNSASANATNSPNPESSSGDSKNSLSSNNGLLVQISQPKIVSEVPNQLFGRTTGLLSAVKISLRRSIVTRQASRVEVKDGKQKRNSSSTKSSVGSSLNSRCELKNISETADSKKVVGRQEHNSSSSKSSVSSSSISGCELKSINRTADNRKAVKVVQPTKQNKRKGTIFFKSSSGKGLSLTVSGQDRIALAPRFNRQEASKSKVLNQAEPRKNWRVLNAQDPLTVGLKVTKNVVDNSKVNPVGPVVGLNQEAGSKDNTIGSKVQRQKAPKNSSEVKDGKGSFAPKAKAGGRNKEKNPKNVVQKKVYFR